MKNPWPFSSIVVFSVVWGGVWGVLSPEMVGTEKMVVLVECVCGVRKLLLELGLFVTQVAKDVLMSSECVVAGGVPVRGGEFFPVHGGYVSYPMRDLHVCFARLDGSVVCGA